MTAAKKTGQGAAGGEPGGQVAAELELARQLAERARAEGLQLTGPGGLLGRLTRVVLEGALEGELDAHLDNRHPQILPHPGCRRMATAEIDGPPDSRGD